jgi:hypothetical protein
MLGPVPFREGFVTTSTVSTVTPASAAATVRALRLSRFAIGTGGRIF